MLVVFTLSAASPIMTSSHVSYSKYVFKSSDLLASTSLPHMRKTVFLCACALKRKMARSPSPYPVSSLFILSLDEVLSDAKY